MVDSRSSIKRVKVVEPDAAGRRASLYSVFIALLAAAAAFIAWNAWRDDEPPPPYQPVLAEVDLQWRCAQGHRFRALGQAGARLCPTCNAASSVVERYGCIEHGLFDVLGEYTSGADGVLTVSRLRIADKPWSDAPGGPKCPHCGRTLRWERRDPMAGLVGPDAADDD